MVAAMGGLLFGYDWVVIGGAKPFYERFFDITHSANLQGWAMSSALMGCVLGALFSGQLSDRYSRKIPLIVAAALFLASAIGTGAVSSFTPFILFRLLGGIGIGLASAISPMYIAEISPPTSAADSSPSISSPSLSVSSPPKSSTTLSPTQYHRGHQMRSSAPHGMDRWAGDGCSGRRISAALFLLLAFLIPESPRFLAKKGEVDGCMKILSKIGGKGMPILKWKTFPVP